jgi:hypothetical protein
VAIHPPDFFPSRPPPFLSPNDCPGRRIPDCGVPRRVRHPPDLVGGRSVGSVPLDGVRRGVPRRRFSSQAYDVCASLGGMHRISCLFIKVLVHFFTGDILVCFFCDSKFPLRAHSAIGHLSCVFPIFSNQFAICVHFWFLPLPAYVKKKAIINHCHYK